MPQMSVRPAAALAVATLLPLIAVAAPLARSPAHLAAQTGRAVQAYRTGPARPERVGPGLIQPGPAWPGRGWPPARLGTT